MGIIRGMFVGVIALAALSGCAKDQTQEDYDNQKALDDVAKYQSVAGRYSGLINNQKSIPLGGLEVQLKALLSTAGSGPSAPGAGSPSAGTSVPHATLTTEVHFRDSRTSADLRTESGYYDPQSGVYEADFDVPMTDAGGNQLPSRRLSITGNINDGHIRGTMQGVGYDTQAASIDLALNGPDLNDLGHMSKPLPGALPEGEASSYPGTFDRNSPQPVMPMIALTHSTKKKPPTHTPPPAPPSPPDTGTKDATLMAIYPITSPNEHFINLFLPDDVKVLEIDLTYGFDVHITFPNAMWDTNSGNLIGESTWSSASTGTVVRHLNCFGFNFVTNSPFKCRFWTDRTPIVSISFGPGTPARTPASLGTP